METNAMKVKDLILLLQQTNEENECEVVTTAGRMPLKEIKSFTDENGKSIILLKHYRMEELK